MQRLTSSFFAAALSILSAPAFAQLPAQPQADRIGAHADLRPASPLPNHIPTWANADNDAGAVPDTVRLRLTFVLTRSPAQQTAFKQLLDDQTNPSSPRFHHWLTPKEVGDEYGPTSHDLTALTDWLLSQGFTIAEISPSRVFVTVDASALTASNAFNTPFRYFHVHGQTRFSASKPPLLPNAFQPLVDSISGLSETTLRPMHHMEVLPLSDLSSPDPTRPRYTNSNGNHYITPGDFATIFDLKSVYQSGINGAGQKVAIIGRSRVLPADTTGYESLTGLPTNLPNVVIPTNGTDPGTTGDGDQGEATLDVDRVIGTAPGIQADLVISASSNTYDGIYIAAQYEVQHLLDPVMTISFGACEVYAGPGGVSLWDNLFAQAASQGISVFISSADSGAATCETQFAVPDDYQFRAINYICASSYATCVGATEPADTANPSLYWSATNGSDRSSALSYIPEGAWNQPTETAASGQTVYVDAATGGGASIYVPKPAWQNGTGVPADNARDVPDLSFPGAGHDAYFACYQSSCTQGYFVAFSGTSAAAPAVAAVAALLNQKAGSAQGNFNPILYRVAASNAAAFHDTTPASSGVANCTVTTPSMCNNSTPSPSGLVGGLAGYALTTGYDQATGLGSLDIANFLTAALAPVPRLTAISLALTENVASITDTQTAIFTATLNFPAGANPTGSVQFFADGTAIGAPVSIAAGLATTPAVPFPAAGSYLISAVYSGDSNFATATAPGVTLTVAGVTSNTVLVNPTTSLAFGSSATFSAAVSGTGASVPTGLIRFFLSGRYDPAPLVNGSATSEALTFPIPGSYNVDARYYGDTVYSPSVSSVSIVTVQRIPTQATLTGAPGSVSSGSLINLTLNIGQTSSPQVTAPSPTGTVQLFQNGLPVGGSIAVASQAVSLQVSAAAAGTYTYTASYSGDVYYAPSSAPAVSVTVTGGASTFTLVPAAPSLALSAGSSQTDILTATQVNGFTGVVNLSCTVAFNGTGATTAPPTCSLAPAQITLSATILSAASTITISTTATHASNDFPAFPGRSLRTGYTLLSSAFALLFCFLSRARTRIRRQRLGLLVLLLVAGLNLSACGGSGSSPTPPPVPGTTPGSYTVTITGTPASGAVVSTTVAVTIN